jgi:hypothetical protein
VTKDGVLVAICSWAEQGAQQKTRGRLASPSLPLLCPELGPLCLKDIPSCLKSIERRAQGLEEAYRKYRLDFHDRGHHRSQSLWVKGRWAVNCKSSGPHSLVWQSSPATPQPAMHGQLLIDLHLLAQRPKARLLCLPGFCWLPHMVELAKGEQVCCFPSACRLRCRGGDDAGAGRRPRQWGSQGCGPGSSGKLWLFWALVGEWLCPAFLELWIASVQGGLQAVAHGGQLGLD